MKVVCNAFPKCGTHALQKACRLLGLSAEIEHWPYHADRTDKPLVFIKRDPRNALVSSIQADGGGVTQGFFIERLLNYSHRAEMPRPFVEKASEFTGWLSAPGVLVVSYENLIASDVEMRRIAEWAGVPYLEDAFENLPGHTMTWMPRHSDYREIWSTEVQDAWASCGGDALLRDWGYG